jgi:outer membrane protein OmpA-like peptidoglycan-associated protein
MIRKYFIFIFLAVLLSGCCPRRTTVVLVPDPEGHVGTVAVRTQGGERLISESGQGVIVKNDKDAPPPATTFNEQKIRDMFGKALDIEPPVPEKFVLHFKIDSTELLPDSKILIPKIIDSIRQRTSLDISVNGHSDRAGKDAYNLDLSLRRARYIEGLIIKAGIEKNISPPLLMAKVNQ